MRFAVVIGIVLLAALAAPGADAEQVYVSVDEAQLRSSQDASATVVANVTRGTALEVLRQDSRWYYVATSQGTQGWIYRYKVTTAPPAGGTDVLGILGGSSSRITMGEASSASGIRGLNPISERQARRRGRQEQAIQAVKEIEAFGVSAEELDRFLRAGKLGEYQEGR